MQKNKFNIGDAVSIIGENPSTEGELKVVAIFKDLMCYAVFSDLPREEYKEAKRAGHQAEIYYFIAVVDDEGEFIGENTYPESKLSLKA